MTSSADVTKSCPNQGRYGYNTHRLIDGVCPICEGEEAARIARLEEKGVFLRG